ncbi:MAG: nitroreductase family protein [Anaerolineaceae bacterium]|nr:nitroreductase family protein [Anaerolineaceae bacterium]
METIKAILTRRSVRHFTADPISPEEQDTLLRAAMHAPSANNQQPWQFIVIDDRQILTGLTEIHPYAGSLLESPIGILVCGDLNLAKSKDYWVQDCSAATQNLLVAAHGLGLGAVWLGVYPRQARYEAIQKFLKLPDMVIPFALIAVGHPANPLPTANRYLAERIHLNKW